MRNPFRKISPEEEFVREFLKGMKAGAESNQEAKDMHALIKVKFNEGDYVAAQKLANEYTQAVTAAFRTESSVAKN